MEITDLQTMHDAALRFATQYHAGQMRESGDTFISHPLAVAARVARADGKVVALLHDVVEETEATYGDLFDAGFPSWVVKSVEALTRRPKHVETYDQYIQRVLQNPIAVRVKLADIDHNLTTIAGTNLSLKQQMRRQKKYRYYRSVLISAL